MSHQSPVTNHRSLLAALREAITRLESEHIPSAPLAAELLLMHTLDCDRTWLYSHPEQELDAAAHERYFSMIARRASGVPTQHLTGHQEFWGLDFEVTPNVLIPRPETEHIIEVVLQRLGIDSPDASSQRDAELHIADVGTGSGCIAIALAHELPSARFIATDISAPALEVARRNASRHAVASRIDFMRCNLMDDLLHGSQITNHASLPLRASESHLLDAPSHQSPATSHLSPLFHIIASNPPYIARAEAATLPREVREHEPESALFGGETGTELYAPLIAQAAKLLKPGGILVLELGDNSAEHISLLLEAAEWDAVEITNDLAGIKRVASARRTTNSNVITAG